LILGWEKKTQEEAQAIGRLNIINEIWPLMIVEIQPIDPDSAMVVWAWHLWDHLINIYDLLKTINLISEGQYHEKADHNYDGSINNLDLEILIDHIMSQ